MAAPRRSFGVLGFAAGVLVTLGAVEAQEVRVLRGSGQDIVVAPGSGVQAVEGYAQPAKPGGIGSIPGRQPPAKPGESAKPEKPDGEKAKPGEAEGKPEGDKAKPGEGQDKPGEEAKPGETAKPIQRPTTPPKPPDPEQLKIRPDADGKIRFNFIGQPWPDVLQWLADVSGMSLDWQELPGDYLNLTTQRSYTLKEARDLINRHLLARGYTLLRQDEVLSVAKLEKLDPGMVPRVAPEELDGRDLHEFVKVSFPLDWLIAETVVEELKPMLSPHGKLTALKATNRLEAVDAVVNLRAIRAVLAEEQSAGGQERLVREFPLQHVRAAEVCRQLEGLLGIQSAAPAAAGAMAAQQAQMQIMMQQQAMMRAQAQRGGQPQVKQPVAVVSPRLSSPVSLVVNHRNNSILAHAPPDKMAIIEQAIRTLDVPAEGDRSLAATMNRMQIYRLVAIDPKPLVKTLEEIGNLDPTTRLELDEKNRAIIVYGTLADHVTIRTLVERLDGSGRQFEVIPLRRLEADYVAGTVQFMMGGKKEKQTQTPRYFGYNPYLGRSQGQSEPEPSGFRVDADVEHNRLLLWANEIELEEVVNLLEKLGEIPAEGGNPSTVRIIDAAGGEETERWLEQIRRAWSSMAPNPLLLPPPEEPAEPPRKLPEASPEAKSPGPASPAADTQTRALPGRPTPKPLVRLAQLRQEEAGTGESLPEEPAGVSPPIRITRGPDGRLIIASEDTRALDLLEELMARFAPPRSDYKIFRLKYAWAFGVSLTLEDIFEEEEKEPRRQYPFWMGYGYGQDEGEEEGVRLSKRRPLKFISDPDTNSILVQGADPAQLAKIEKLIEFYDQPEPTDSQSVRKTEIFLIHYSKAKVVAEAVKDVYRDLLSANDRALTQGAQQQRRQRSGYTVVYNTGDGDEEKRAPSFKGLLSIGVDDLSNTLVVSAPAYLLENVRDIIRDLDEAARPTSDTVEVLQLGRGVSAARVQEVLSNVLGTPASGRKPAAKPAAGQQRQPRRPGPQPSPQGRVQGGNRR